ncbi:Retrovirus-related Pol polyprotein from transposon RE1 [Sesamum angolense]|uniref:Retrovirus-related Pol polyprotein from transposon RE1 n=1 Tax=Sesamum angolense TaxID=2727404 RepID=A0AAE2BVX5_9LAMI|nr:Retrovirus-related Pol polyprotein from transposon RE1 [Sesamum angolense]
MVLRVERQRRVHLEYADVRENTAMNTRNMEYNLNTGHRMFQKKKGSMEKKHMICEHCCKPGNNKETCFKLHGIPEWYKDLNEHKKRRTFNNRVYVATETQNFDDRGGTQRVDIISELMEALKLVQTKDLMTKKPLAVGKQVGKLYLLDNESFIPATSLQQSCNSAGDVSVTNSKYDIWHRHFIHPSYLASSHTDFLAALSTIQEPSNYLQAKSCKEWEDAISQELSALERNNTWEVVNLPKGEKPIGNKWVFKIKLKADGSIDRYKARLVAKGYNQVEGVDYVDRFSPVAKAVTVRTFLAVASSHGWPIHQVAINNAFLHGFLDEDIYACARWLSCLTGTGAGLVALIVYVDDVHLSHNTSLYETLCEMLVLLSAKSVSSLFLDGLKLSPLIYSLTDPEPYTRFGRDAQRGLFFPASTPFTFTAYCDTYWASCADSHLSLIGYCIFLGVALISWKTKKQTTVARSTAEAEYHNLGTTICELQWVTYLLSDLSIQVSTPIPLYCDNQVAIHIVANPVFHERTKHLENDCHLVRDKFKAGFVFPRHISGRQQLADVLTKSLSGSQFSNLLSKMGLMSFPQSILRGDEENQHHCKLQ